MGPSGLVSGRRERFTEKGLSVRDFSSRMAAWKASGGGVGGHVDGAQAPGVGHRGGQPGLGQPLHGPLDDGVLDAEELGDAGFHGRDPSFCGFSSMIATPPGKVKEGLLCDLPKEAGRSMKKTGETAEKPLTILGDGWIIIHS